jgi:hypothetical protein
LHCVDQCMSDIRRISWEQLSDKKMPITWEIDPEDGVIQGPLDLCFLDGQTLHLVLKPGQVALLAVRGEERAFYPDGTYLLSVGADGVAAGSLVYFMHTERSFSINWRQIIPMPHIEPGAAATREASGSFDVRIDSPVRFYREMLCNHAGEGENICNDVLSRIMPTLLTIHLAQACGPDSSVEEQRTALAALRPDDLAGDLAPYGLVCMNITIDASFLNPLGKAPQPVSL